MNPSQNPQIQEAVQRFRALIGKAVYVNERILSDIDKTETAWNRGVDLAIREATDIFQLAIERAVLSGSVLEAINQSLFSIDSNNVLAPQPDPVQKEILDRLDAFSRQLASAMDGIDRTRGEVMRLSDGQTSVWCRNSDASLSRSEQQLVERMAQLIDRFDLVLRHMEDERK